MSYDAARVVAILDLGSARTKMTVGRILGDGQLEFLRVREETVVAGNQLASGVISVEAEENLDGAIRRLLRVAAHEGCEFVATVATSAFRKAPNGHEVLARLEGLVGRATILDPVAEGRIFYSFTRYQLRPGAEMCAVDVGGGSVQVAWGDGADTVVSLPTGTFELEHMFQGPGVPTDADYKSMRRFIEKEAASALSSLPVSAILVFGSNCMEDFVSSALSVVGWGNLLLKSQVLTLSLDDITRLYEAIKGRPYDELGELYPANPTFMRGADKALLNVIVIAALVGATEIVPTNESLSTSLAGLALTAPGVLKGYGVTLSPIHAPQS